MLQVLAYMETLQLSDLPLLNPSAQAQRAHPKTNRNKDAERATVLLHTSASFSDVSNLNVKKTVVLPHAPK